MFLVATSQTTHSASDVAAHAQSALALAIPFALAAPSSAICPVTAHTASTPAQVTRAQGRAQPRRPLRARPRLAQLEIPTTAQEHMPPAFHASALATSIAVTESIVTTQATPTTTPAQLVRLAAAAEAAQAVPPSMDLAAFRAVATAATTPQKATSAARMDIIARVDILAQPMLESAALR